MRRYSSLLLLVLIALLAWYFRDNIADIIVPKSPREVYVRTQKRALGNNNAEFLHWQAINDKALRNSTKSKSAFKADLFFDFAASAESSAISFQFSLKQGRRLSIKLETDLETKPFTELYIIGKDQEGTYYDRVDYLGKTASSLVYDVEESGNYVLLIQAAIQDQGFARLSVQDIPSLAFPVAAVSDRAAQSFWGADRDGGRRKHEGVDIFADRGTDLLAVADGRISRVKEGGLGGKVVWLWLEAEALSVYYAHLDEQLVEEGDLVRTGDVVGTVGNTGNARTTPAHLHFGIYPGGGKAVDPWPFIDRVDEHASPPTSIELGSWQSIPQRGTYLLKNNLKDEQANSIRKLSGGERVFLSGRLNSYNRITTKKGESGFVLWP